ncbi:MAG TPA: hypothetical protein VGE18_01500 [Candidatus Paceibacterota bacterium]
MDDKFPKLNLEQFAHGYQNFFEVTCELLDSAERTEVLPYLLTDDINSQYRYSPERRSGHTIMDYLKKGYLSGEQDIFLSFFNELLPNIILYLKKEVWNFDQVPFDLRSNLKTMVIKLTDLVIESENSSVFNIDFYYDKKAHVFKRKLDKASIELVNSNRDDLGGDNKIRYEKCVSDFLLYKKEKTKNNKLFYNESLGNLKKVVENTLQNNYKKGDGTFPRLHNKRELSNILFDGNNTEFENLVDYVIKNIHHEQEGQPKIFTEKEYVYLWLELNKILYLLNRYRK